MLGHQLYSRTVRKLVRSRTEFGGDRNDQDSSVAVIMGQFLRLRLGPTEEVPLEQRQHLLAALGPALLEPLLPLEERCRLLDEEGHALFARLNDRKRGRGPFSTEKVR